MRPPIQDDSAPGLENAALTTAVEANESEALGIEDEDTAAESEEESPGQEPAAEQEAEPETCDGNEFNGAGLSLPNRIHIIGNREYRLGYANNLNKWAVFWFFTFCTSFIPYMC